MRNIWMGFCLLGAALLASGACGQTPGGASPAGIYNLSGAWRSPTSNGQSAIVRFEQQGDQFRGYFGGAVPSPSDLLGFEGHYSGKTIVGKSLLTPASAGHPAQWVDRVMIVDDPDHAHFQNHPEMMRISEPHSGDAPCDAANSSHTKGTYADRRGKDAEKHNDFPAATCWYHVGIVQRNPQAETDYAWLLESGKLGMKDFPEALKWAKQGAEQHDITADMLLAHMYAAGEGVPADPKAAEYWNHRAEMELTYLGKQKQQRNVQQAQRGAPPQMQQQRQQSPQAAQQQVNQAQMGLMMLLGAAMMDEGNSGNGGGSSNDIEDSSGGYGSEQQQEERERYLNEQEDKAIRQNSLRNGNAVME